MSVLAKAIIGRFESIPILETTLAEQIGPAERAGHGSKEMKALEETFTQLEEATAFYEDASDDQMQIAELKSRGRDLMRKQVAVAKLILTEGESGLRESVCWDYEQELLHIAATIKRLT